jgi:hypothetical protein
MIFTALNDSKKSPALRGSFITSDAIDASVDGADWERSGPNHSYANLVRRTANRLVAGRRWRWHALMWQYSSSARAWRTLLMKEG